MITTIYTSIKELKGTRSLLHNVIVPYVIYFSGVVRAKWLIVTKLGKIKKLCFASIMYDLKMHTVCRFPIGLWMYWWFSDTIPEGRGKDHIVLTGISAETAEGKAQLYFNPPLAYSSVRLSNLRWPDSWLDRILVTFSHLYKCAWFNLVRTSWQ